MADIRYYKLQNTGAFVAKMDILWTGDDGHGNESHGKHHDSHDIDVAADHTIDMTKTEIPDGAEVQLKAIVVLGKDKTASEKHRFVGSSNTMAEYTVSGTTLNNKIREDSVH